MLCTVCCLHDLQSNNYTKTQCEYQKQCEDKAVNETYSVIQCADQC